MLTLEEAQAIYDAGSETTVGKLRDLSREIDSLRVQVTKQETQIKGLKDQMAKNSRNSSKPPASDGPKKPKPKSLRKKGERKTGGQKGHKGHTLEQADNPDHTVVHAVVDCSNCGCDLSEQPSNEPTRRQVFDLPEPTGLEVTEHQAENKTCSNCHHVNRAEFPTGVNAPVQYGPRVKATAAYLRDYQLLPSQRTCELLLDLYGIKISEGTVANIIGSLGESLVETDNATVEVVKKSPVVHFDETSTSVEKKRLWLHVASTNTATHYQVHEKRGTKAIDAIGILPKFQGRAVHDHWKPYLTYDCGHALCNAHHLRELIFIHEEHNQKWAQDMINCLLAIKEAVDEAKSKGLDRLSDSQILDFEAHYQKVIDAGYAENPLPEQLPSEKKKRGRPKKTKSLNLLERLNNYRKETLMFMYDFRVPFDNNLGERDIRMTKVQMKISGTFRSRKSADSFCRIRSYISTARKNGKSAIDALYRAFTGTPYLPPATSAGQGEAVQTLCAA
jgi:transposase